MSFSPRSRASHRRPGCSPPWASSPFRAELVTLYREADALLAGWRCARCAGGEDPRCCRFDETGREPYPTAVEVEEVRYAAARRGPGSADDAAGRRGREGANAGAPGPPRRLPVAGAPCPLLTAEGRCGIYASRPLGCRTFFCRDAEGPGGPRSKIPRDALASVSRRIADLSARFAPRDPHPRPLLRALAAAGSGAGRPR